MRVIGVDPGKSGALALVERVNGAVPVLVDAVDVPLLDDEIDVLEVIRWIMEKKANHAFVERVQAMPAKRSGDQNGKSHSMGAVSAFNFGANYGALKACVRGRLVPMTIVTPTKWKGFYGLPGVTADKDAKEKARARAISLFPGAADMMKRKKDSGRAEAGLIALYGLGLV